MGCHLLISVHGHACIFRLQISKKYCYAALSQSLEQSIDLKSDVYLRKDDAVRDTAKENKKQNRTECPLNFF